MNAEEFNALPLEARRYIENQKTCLSCGKANDLDAHYKNYLKMKIAEFFTLRIGAVAFKDSKGNGVVLYPVGPNDTDEEARTKLGYALAVNAVAPNRFSFINTEKIEKFLAETPEEKAPLRGAAKAAAEKKAPLRGAAKAAAEKKAAEATKGDDLD